MVEINWSLTEIAATAGREYAILHQKASKQLSSSISLPKDQQRQYSLVKRIQRILRKTEACNLANPASKSLEKHQSCPTVKPVRSCFEKPGQSFEKPTIASMEVK